LISKATAPGKIILFGEHFVVHGTHAVVCAINKRVSVTSETNDTAAISIESSLGKAAIPITEDVDTVEKKFRPFFFIAKEVISDHNFKNGINIKIESDIPIGAGLGSSSACCVAGAASISNLFSKPDISQILDMSIDAERTIFPKTSGADCTVSALGGIIEYQKESDPKSIKTEHDFDFVVVNSQKMHNTDAVVSRVNQFKEKNEDAFSELCKEEDNLISKAVYSLQTFDLDIIGKCMSQNQIFLERIGVSNNVLLDIVKSIEKETFGAKLTGAGDGGCVIALTEKSKKDSVVKNMSQKYETFPVTIEKTGMQVNITN
jgi:mevalonate kinase|tara:strand:- start:4756 stop:5709 length:954 start_codon:yes stop_codon:yes gene_type:complete